METWIPYVVIFGSLAIAVVIMTIRHRRKMKAIRKVLDDI